MANRFHDLDSISYETILILNFFRNPGTDGGGGPDFWLFSFRGLCLPEKSDRYSNLLLAPRNAKNTEMSGDAVVIIPAAGQGKRMAAGQNKLLLPLGTQTILQHTLDLFLKHPQIFHIYLVIAEKDKARIASSFAVDDKITLLSGGIKRQDSVFNALVKIQQQTILPRWILVHDGARPLCPPTLIEKVLKQCTHTGAAIPVVPLTDTIRQITPQGTKVLDRSQLFATQTPQGFEAQLLINAYQIAQINHWNTTDDASIVEQWGHPVATVEGVKSNLKITTLQDLEQAEWQLTQLQ